MSQTVKEKVRLWAEFGAWIKHERENASPRMTQDQAASKAGITVVTWSRIENGQATKRDTVIAMASAIKADVSEALRRSGFTEGSGAAYDDAVLNDLSHSLHRYKQLSENSRKFANRHFSETVNFLHDVENERMGESDSKPGTSDLPETLRVNTTDDDLSGSDDEIESPEFQQGLMEIDEYVEKYNRGEQRKSNLPPSKLRTATAEDAENLSSVKLVKGKIVPDDKDKKPPKRKAG